MNCQSEKTKRIIRRKKTRYNFESSDLPPAPPAPPASPSPSSSSSLLLSPNKKLKINKKSTNIDKDISENVENAFERLSKLYALVEEIIEIRDKNSKLFKRVRELERTKASRKANYELEKSITNGQDIYLPDEDVGFAESLLGAMLSSFDDDDNNNNNNNNNNHHHQSSRWRDNQIINNHVSPSSPSTTTTSTIATPTTPTATSSLRKRNFNNSSSIDQRRVSCPIVVGQDNKLSFNRRNSIGKIGKNNYLSTIKRPSLVFGQPKISKWTKVKAAFKWEKAVCNHNNNNNNNNCELLNNPTIDNSNNSNNNNSLRYLKIPLDNNGASVVLSEISTPVTPVGTMSSSSSSIDDVFHRSHRTCHSQTRRVTRHDDDIEEKSDSDPSRRSRSLDGETSAPIHDDQASINKDVNKIEYKSHKTPWSKMKDIMQLRRDSLGRQINSRNSRHHDDNHSTSSLDSTDILRTDLDDRQPRLRVTSEPSQLSINYKKYGTKQKLQVGDLTTRRLTPMLTITVPSSEELRTLSSPELITPPSTPTPNLQQQQHQQQRREPDSPIQSVSRYALGRSKTSQGVHDDYKRQHSSKGDSLGSSPKTQRRNSKWNKVKRAFLTGPTSVPTSPSRISSYFFDDGDVTASCYSASASAEDLDNDASTNNPAAQAEIQRNYRLLHDKLGAEFYRKLAEWEKLKAIKDLRSVNRERETRILCEERLTPEFKKKLEEWKRMSKGSMTNESRSVSKRRITDWQLWRSSPKTDSHKIDNTIGSSGLSDDFIKKMEEWKKIKSTSVRRHEDFDNKYHHHHLAVVAAADDDEKEKIKQQEKQDKHEDGDEDNDDSDDDDDNDDDNDDDEEESYSFENKNKYINKFEGWKGLEDEEFKSLDKIIGAMENERQTRLSKLHRVVGSAPEKTQEILVHTSTGYYRFEGISKTFTRKLYEWEKSQGITPELSTFRLLDPLRYGISSDSRKPSVNFTSNKQVIRTTTSTPIRSKSVGCLLAAESWRTKIDKPVVNNNHNNKGHQWSLSLNDIDRHIEPVFQYEEDTLDDAGLDDLEHEPEAMIVDIEDVIEETASPLTKLQPHQTPVYSVASSETTSIAIPLGTVTSIHESSPAGILIEPDEIHTITINNNNNDDDDESTDSSLRFAIAQSDPIFDDDDDDNDDKFTSDAENTKADVEKNNISVNESNNNNNNIETEDKQNQEKEDMEKTIITVAGRQHGRLKNNLKTRRLTDTQIWYDKSSFNSNNKIQNEQLNDQDVGKYIHGANIERIILNKDTLNKIVVPTSLGTLDMSITSNTPSSSSKINNDDDNSLESIKKTTKEPKNVFVKTKRIVFSPFKRDNKIKNSNNINSNNNDNDDNEKIIINKSSEFKNSLQRSKRMTIDIPKSPILSRKEYKNLPSYLPKETSPGIRMMIKKYNEKIEGSMPGSGTSSGSASPIWRSPVTQRRIKTRMEKYQEEVRKAIAGPSSSSSSSSYRFEFNNNNNEKISKSATIDFSKNYKNDDSDGVLRSETMPEIIKIDYEKKKNNSTMASSRTLKIQKAKQDFFQREQKKIQELNSRKIVDNYDDDDDREMKNLTKADLIKSASVGMINIESNAFERLQLSSAVSTLSNRGYDSLPRSSEQFNQQQQSNKESRFHQLTSKFKKAKLKKSRVKESSSMSTVSMLCRQSLLVDIGSEGSKSCPTTPSPSASSSHYEYSTNTH